MMERRQTWMVTAVLVFFSSVMSYVAGATGLIPQLSARLAPNAPLSQNGAPAAGDSVDLKKVQQIQEYIQKAFIEPVPADKLTNGALKGMVEATGDKYSTYFTATEYEQFLAHFDPTFSGIGVTVEISPKTGLVTVVAPFKGSPGERAGLRPGDTIVKVDDKDTTETPLILEQVVKQIRGPKGTKVKLTVHREGAAAPLEFVITRATIEVPSIEYKMADQEAGVGYIQVREFNRQITDRVTRAMTDLRAQGMTRLVLDLRMNPGGLLDEAIGISSLFVPAGQPVVHIVERGGEKETKSSRAKQPSNIPLVVLVDENSASASEIVAGAIKDLKIGVLMGKKTFGKGSVQSFYDLPDGSGIKLTTAKYLTAGGNSIHEKGIDPDIVVENPKDKRVLPGDPGDVQLAEAIRHVKTLKR